MLIIGLGNPGIKYRNTRHNAGFIVLDYFIEKNKINKLSVSIKNNCMISEDCFNGKKIVLMKPLTFMNLSGVSAKKIVKKMNEKIEDLVLIHDDIDIPVGKIRVSKNRGAAGHKGVLSVMNELKTKDFARIRVGVLPEQKPTDVRDFVVKSFSTKEKKLFNESIGEACIELEKLISQENKIL